MGTFVDNYVQGLFNSYNERNKECFKLITPASDEKINLLRSIYPNIPSELISLLNIVNGSHYSPEKYIRGLDFFQLYPDTDQTRYSFCTIEEMLAYEAEGDYSWLSLCWDEASTWNKEDVMEMFDEDVNPEALIRERILFAETDYSQLYIDFNPSEFGTMGQIVAYIHDPDSYFKIAESFSEFLKSHIDSNFEFFETN